MTQPMCAELGLGSAADQAIFDRAQREGRVVVSRDLGFANLASRSAEHNGVLLLRFGGIRSSSIISGLLAALTSQDAAAANFSNTVVVLEPGRIRTRRIP